MFLLTSMPIGGAETLLVNLIRRFDPERIQSLVGCMKHRDVLGDEIADEVPVFENLIRHKYDVGVVGRLKKIFVENSVDVLITVGAGDKMFWGRLAARQAKLPVILSALHSTGWPDGVGKLNRMLTGITDGFIAVAKQHAEYQVNNERFPEDKVFLIPNGIDTDRFVFDSNKRLQWRSKLGISESDPVVGIVAALRPEKNHKLFLEAAQRVANKMPNAQFVIAGDGPERAELENLARQFGIADQVHFLGSVSDVVGVLSMLDLFALTSHNEASPVSILEAFSCQRPVVATDVGSIDETVLTGTNGFLVPEGSLEDTTARWLEVLSDRSNGEKLGAAGRQRVVENSSLDSMTNGYMELVEDLFSKKESRRGGHKFGVASESSAVTWDYNVAASETSHH
jgi:glycosyltransferase involved in cell wall biosynthesis